MLSVDDKKSNCECKSGFDKLRIIHGNELNEDDTSP
jgi:hypothetical protein